MAVDDIGTCSRLQSHSWLHTGRVERSVGCVTGGVQGGGLGEATNVSNARARSPKRVPRVHASVTRKVVVHTKSRRVRAAKDMNTRSLERARKDGRVIHGVK